MKKKILSIVLILTFIAGLTGCVNKSGTNPDSNTSSNISGTADTAASKETDAKAKGTGEKTVVTFQTWNPMDSGPESAIHKIISDFEAKNPDITINYVYVDSGSHFEQLKVKLMGGEGPDLYGMRTGSYFEAFRDFEEDITPYCKSTWGDNWESKFYDFCMKPLATDGKYYAVPLGITYAGFAWCDKNMLKSYGLDIPASYSDLLEASKVLRKNKQFPLAIGAKDTWLDVDTWMSMANDINSEKLYSAIEGKTPFTDTDLVKSFEIWQKCFTDGIFQDGALGMTQYNDVNDMFQKEGSIPMFLNGSWALNMFTLADAETHKVFNSEGADHDIFLIDWNDDGKVCPVTAAADVLLCMNKNSKVKDAAFKFMDYLVNEGQDLLVNNYLEYMPSRTDMKLNVQGLGADGQEALQVVLNNAKDNVAGARSIVYAELDTKVQEVLQALAAGQMTPQEAAEQVEAVSKTTKR